MLTRRAFAASGLAAAAVPALAEAAPPVETSLTLFQQHNRYVPLWRWHDQLRTAQERTAQATVQFMALIGNEAGALTDYPQEAVPPLDGWAAVDALDAIAERARDARMVIINEAHNTSGHRSFVAQVLRRLRPMGFNWYAAETFTRNGPVDLAAWKAGDPIHPWMGYYTKDPVYAELVREAGDLGYRLVDYEADEHQYVLPSTAPGADLIAEREEAQATNLIERFLTPNPRGRVIVHCGFSHAAEAPVGRLTWMAARLKAKSGVDPVTVEQAFSWSGKEPGGDPSLTRAVRKRFGGGTPLAVARDGVFLVNPPYGGLMDIGVVHPDYRGVEGRPGWLAADPARRRHPLRLPRPAKAYTLLQAIPAHEPDPAVPSDQYPLPVGERDGVLWLRPGRYRLRLETLEGYEPLGEAVVGP